MLKFGNPATRLALKRKEVVDADYLFLEAPLTNWDYAPSTAMSHLFDAFHPDTDDLVFRHVIPEFTIEELTKACTRLSVGKASGPSGISNEELW